MDLRGKSAFVVAFLALGCATSSTSAGPSAARAPAGAADRSYQLLAGRFDSADQARSSPGYPALQMEACPADVPSLGPRVLYVEQTRVDGSDAPVRQRVYALEPGEPLDSVAVARIFELENPRAAVRACARGRPPRFDRDELVERVGCAVALHAEGALFRGTTTGRGCPTTQGDATYATSEWMIDAVGVRSRETGFDATGARRWGNDSGPVSFVRRSPPPILPSEPARSPLRGGPQVTGLQ